MTVVYQANGLSGARLGISIAKKSVHDANRRNRIKRHIREYFRRHRHELPGCDLVFIAAAGAGSATRSQLTSAIEALWKQVLIRCAS